MPWDVIFAVGSAGLAAGYALCMWVPPRRRREVVQDDLDQVLESIAGMERRQKMLMGRVNNIAPPREGTGAGAPAREAQRELELEPRPRSPREEILRAALGRRRGGDGAVE